MTWKTKPTTQNNSIYVRLQPAGRNQHQFSLQKYLTHQKSHNKFQPEGIQTLDYQPQIANSTYLKLHPSRRIKTKHHRQSQKLHRKQELPAAQMMNGNYKLMQLNKGDSELQNQIPQINNMLQTHKPQILVLNELNLHKNDKTTKYLFDNYTLEHDNLNITDIKSRTGILLHRDIQYSRRKDLETNGTSTIWIQLKFPGKKSVLLQGIYRQFKRLGRKGSGTYKNQTARWKTILEKWELAQKEKLEIITLGDFNINQSSWNKTQSGMSDYEKAQAPLVQLFREKILNRGYQVLNSKPTRVPNNIESKPSCLDLIVTNEKKQNYKS